jgi:RNA polymerase sigma-70 factor (ECF subfamily)
MANYTVSSEQPSPDQLAPVQDNTNPLYIKLGNPFLKSSISLYKSRLFYYGRRFFLEWHEVEDIVADAFLALWRARAQLRNDDHIRNFLFFAVRNKALNVLESKNRQQEVYDEMAAQTSASLESEVLGADKVEAEMLQLLQRAVRELSPEYRRIFEAAYHQEKSPSEIARILNVNPATVRSQKRRAIGLLRDWCRNMLLSSW